MDNFDSNEDGSISREELAATLQDYFAKAREQVNAHFEAADADGDDAVSREELEAAFAARREERGNQNQTASAE